MIYRNALITCVILTLSLVHSARAAERNSFILEGTSTHHLRSTHTGVDHELVVALPASYHSSKKHYPVVYFLDAYWDMPLVYATYGNLQYDNLVPEMILVGLSLPKDTDYGAHRVKFFSPTAQDPGDKQSGQAAALYSMLTKEAVPHIEKRYRTYAEPRYRGLAGQSMGGLFTLFALYQTPAVFSRFIAVNPAAEWDNGSIKKLDKSYAKKNKQLAARLFISHGSEEYKPFRDGIISYQNQLQSQDYKGLQLLIHTLNGMRHTGGKGEAYARGLMWIFQDIVPAGKSGLQRDMGG